MHRVRISNDLSHWIEFFLDATIYTAKNAKFKFKEVVSLVEDYKKQVIELPGKPSNNLKILETFFDEPYQNGKIIQTKVDVSKTTVDKALKEMLDANILKEVTGYNRNRIYVLEKYVQIFAAEKS